METFAAIKKLEADFQGAVERFQEESARIRTGRVKASLVEDVRVECYDSKMPIKQLATINIPEARTIIIHPWDKRLLGNIEKAVVESGLGIHPANDGQVIRLNFPPLTEEKRKETVKLLNRLSENSRIAIRNLREGSWKTIQEAEKKGELAEDEKFRAKDLMQKAVDEYNNKIEQLRKKREEEIMEI